MTPETEYREPFLIRTQGGPQDGERLIHDGQLGMTWPLPELLWVDGFGDGNFTGAYRKVMESCLPAQPAGSHVVRGATYQWHQAELSMDEERAGGAALPSQD